VRSFPGQAGAFQAPPSIAFPVFFVWPRLGGEGRLRAEGLVRCLGGRTFLPRSVLVRVLPPAAGAVAGFLVPLPGAVLAVFALPTSFIVAEYVLLSRGLIDKIGAVEGLGAGVWLGLVWLG
jgi:hypothetical protein